MDYYRYENFVVHAWTLSFPLVQDKDTIRNYCKDSFDTDVEDVSMSYKGWNWGEASIEGALTLPASGMPSESRSALARVARGLQGRGSACLGDTTRRCHASNCCEERSCD